MPAVKDLILLIKDMRDYMSTVQTNLENMFVKGESLNVESKENVSITGDGITFKGGWCFLSGSNI